MDYSWPGNVRQLESAIERAILLCEGDQITVDDLPLEVRQESRPVSEGAFKLPPEGISFEDVERDLIMQAMDQTDYNITKSAKLLGLTFRTLQYRLEVWNKNKKVRARPLKINQGKATVSRMAFYWTNSTFIEAMLCANQQPLLLYLENHGIL